MTGATGGQGGSVVSALLASGTAGTKIRAITRDISSEKAKKLASKGIEVHQADLGDRSTLTKVRFAVEMPNTSDGPGLVSSPSAIALCLCNSILCLAHPRVSQL